jgi:hypothetical protein
MSSTQPQLRYLLGSDYHWRTLSTPMLSSTQRAHFRQSDLYGRGAPDGLPVRKDNGICLTGRRFVSAWLETVTGNVIGDEAIFARASWRWMALE